MLSYAEVYVSSGRNDWAEWAKNRFTWVVPTDSTFWVAVPSQQVEVEEIRHEFGGMFADTVVRLHTRRWLVVWDEAVRDENQLWQTALRFFQDSDWNFDHATVMHRDG